MLLSALAGIYFILINLTNAEIFTASDEVGNLLETHKQVINDVYFYINTENKTLSILKRYLDLFRSEYELASEDVSSYVENPLNAFVLINRLTTDLKHVNTIIEAERENANNMTKTHEGMQYPEPEDLIGTVKSLKNLQEIYGLDIKDIARGKLDNFESSTLMTAGDCYELARILFKELDPESAIAWMEEALRKYHEEKFPYVFNDIDIMEFITYGHHLLGEKENALHWTKKILKINPKHSRSRLNIKRLKKAIKKQKVKPDDELDSEEEDYENEYIKNHDENQMPNQIAVNDPNTMDNYQGLCRGDVGVPVQISSRLKCRYITENNPFLKIAPFKAEMVYVNPDVILFHDVLSDSEINRMKELARPRLRRARIADPITEEPIFSEDRISKSATMSDTYFNILARVSRRAAYMTGLSMENTHETQVANYGIGGYYLPHHDFTSENGDTYNDNGRRIATVIFYLSNVRQGGATVFTHLGVSVAPVKGTALFWYNLHSSGEANHALIHAGCPVIRGSKWVATKWIHQAGQEFLRPCNLEYESEGYDRKIPGLMDTATNEHKRLGVTVFGANVLIFDKSTSLLVTESDVYTDRRLFEAYEKASTRAAR